MSGSCLLQPNCQTVLLITVRGRERGRNRDRERDRKGERQWVQESRGPAPLPRGALGGAGALGCSPSPRSTAVICRKPVDLALCALATDDLDVRYTAVSSFIFLRFFAPAILSPNLFQLTPHHTVSEHQPYKLGPSPPVPAGDGGPRPDSLPVEK